MVQPGNRPAPAAPHCCSRARLSPLPWRFLTTRKPSRQLATTWRRICSYSADGRRDGNTTPSVLPANQETIHCLKSLRLKPPRTSSPKNTDIAYERAGFRRHTAIQSLRLASSTARIRCNPAEPAGPGAPAQMSVGLKQRCRPTRERAMEQASTNLVTSLLDLLPALQDMELWAPFSNGYLQIEAETNSTVVNPACSASQGKRLIASALAGKPSHEHSLYSRGRSLPFEAIACTSPTC